MFNYIIYSFIDICIIVGFGRNDNIDGNWVRVIKFWIGRWNIIFVGYFKI